jgi:hypothetical protein
MFLSRFLKYSTVATTTTTTTSLGQRELVENLFQGIVSNKRASLARSITLVETTHPQKRILSQLLLNRVLAKLKEDRKDNKKLCLRLGINI